MVMGSQDWEPVVEAAVKRDLGCNQGHLIPYWTQPQGFSVWPRLGIQLWSKNIIGSYGFIYLILPLIHSTIKYLLSHYIVVATVLANKNSAVSDRYGADSLVIK